MRPDGTRCKPGEPGELVHRGALVALGYWGDQPVPPSGSSRHLANGLTGVPLRLAVWSGDTVVADEEGYLYFVGRRDEMIKTSGYRVSPTESRRLLTTRPRPEMWSLWGWKTRLGQRIVLLVTAAGEGLDQVFDRLYAQQAAALHTWCRVNRGARPPAQITERQIRPEPAEG